MGGLFKEKVEGMLYTFFSRVLVQIVLIIYLMIQAELWYMYILLSVIMILLVMSNIQLYFQEKLHMSFVRRLLIREFLIVLPLFPFVSYAPYYIFFMVLLVTAILLLDGKWERLLFSTGFMIFPVLHSVYLGVGHWQTYLSLGLLILFFAFFAYAVRRLQEQEEEAKTLNQQLEDFSVQEQELAVVKERVRIARDIHDTVAHKATGLIIQ